jgi:hypothetical protein
MDYSNKLLIGLGTAPAIICSVLLFSQLGVVGYLLVFLVFVAATVLYKSVVVEAEHSKFLRFALFTTIPFALFAVVMYV